MPVPDTSEYTRQQRLLTIISAQGTSRNNVFYYIPPITAAASSFFLPQARLPSDPSAPLVPTYTLSQSAVTVNEGGSVVFTVTTTNVADGTTLYWTTTGTAEASDFTDDSDNGSFVITSNTGTITRDIKPDVAVDPSETFVLSVHTGSIAGTVIATSDMVTITDTTPTYSVSANTTSVDEGSSVIFTVTTTNVADGTSLYWTTSGTATAEDFVDNGDSGSFLITANSGEVVRAIKSDSSISEGGETFTLSIRTGSIAGTIVASSETVTINDTSQSVQYTWTQRSAAPSQQYYELATTSAFTPQISTRQSTASGQQGPYISVDNGENWTLKATGITLLTNGISYTIDVAVASEDGSVMYAAQRRTFVSTLASTYDKLYKTINTGDSWTALSAPDSTWQSIACSSDGQIILAGNSNSGNASYDRRWAISTNGGSTWSPGPTIGQWTDVAMSADGTRMYAVTAGGANLYRSSNTGTSWSTTAAGAEVRSVACSANGLTVLIGRGSAGAGSTPMVSTDGGVSFTAVSTLPGGYWDAIAISGDGTTMVAARNVSGRVYLSTDSGTTWHEQTSSPATTWASFTMNFDGTLITAGASTTGKPYLGTSV